EAPARSGGWGSPPPVSIMGPNDRLLLICGAWMSLNASSTAYWTSYGPLRPSAIRLAGAIVQGRTEHSCHRRLAPTNKTLAGTSKTQDGVKATIGTSRPVFRWREQCASRYQHLKVSRLKRQSSS